MHRSLKCLVELPVRKALSNESILQRVAQFPPNTISGVVFSDKAGGLSHFCEAEDIAARELPLSIRQALKESGNGTEIWNVLRTGDRCVSQLQSLVDSLRIQGVNGFVMVSGHDYRTKLKEIVSKGATCENTVCAPRKRNSEASILCGSPSSNVLQNDLINFRGAKKGQVWNTGDVKNTSHVDFQITQACPPLVTTEWLLNLEEQVEHLPKVKTYITVIPTLSLKELERVKSLGTDLPLEKLRMILAADDAKERGLNLAKDAMQVCSKHDFVHGFYLYSHDIQVLVQLAEFARTL